MPRLDLELCPGLHRRSRWFVVPWRASYLRPFSVSFLYSLSAASKIDSNCEEDTSVWECEDMVPVMGGVLVKIADWQSVGASRWGSLVPVGFFFLKKKKEV